MKTTAKVIGLDKFSTALKSLSDAARGDALGKAAMAGGQVIEANAKINANEVFSEHATNNLAGSIETRISEARETYAEVGVGSNAVHARIHELGGVIRPVFAKFLHFTTYDGEEVFTKVVHMPARPYLRPAVDENEDDIAAAVEYQIRKNIEAVL